MAKDKSIKPDMRPRISIVCTGTELNAMRKLLAGKASKTADGKLNMADMILQELGVREAEKDV